MVVGVRHGVLLVTEINAEVVRALLKTAQTKSHKGGRSRTVENYRPVVLQDLRRVCGKNAFRKF
jgi:DUF971 family protein